MTREMMKPSTVKSKDNKWKNANVTVLRKSEKTRCRSNESNFSDVGGGTEFGEGSLKLTIETGRRSWSLQNHRCSDTDRRERTSAGRERTCRLYIQDEKHYKRIPLLAASAEKGKRPRCCKYGSVIVTVISSTRVRRKLASLMMSFTSIEL